MDYEGSDEGRSCGEEYYGSGESGEQKKGKDKVHVELNEYKIAMTNVGYEVGRRS